MRAIVEVKHQIDLLGQQKSMRVDFYCDIFIITLLRLWLHVVRYSNQSRPESCFTRFDIFIMWRERKSQFDPFKQSDNKRSFEAL